MAEGRASASGSTEFSHYLPAQHLIGLTPDHIRTIFSFLVLANGLACSLRLRFLDVALLT